MARRHVPHRLGTANGFDGMPPGGRAVVRGASPPPPSKGLTPIFNAKAKKLQVAPKQSPPASKERIKALEKKLSRPAHTLEMSPSGNVIGSYDPNRDRKIRHEIKSMQKALAKRSGMARNAFAKANLKNKAKQSFNRPPGRRM